MLVLLSIFLMTTYPEYVAWIVVGVAALYWYFTRNHGYWKKAGVPYIPPIALFGSSTFALKRPLHEFEIERVKEYGRVYGYFEGNRPHLVIADPELLKNILLKDFQVFPNHRKIDFIDPLVNNMLSFVNGETWKKIRTTISPTFSTGKMKRMLSIFDECAETLNKNFLKASNEGETINSKELFGAYCMDVIAIACFSTKLDSLNDPNSMFVQMAKKAFIKRITWKMIFFGFFPTIAKYMGISIFDRKAVKFFRDMTLEIIEERERSGQKCNDFLQLLLDANKENSQDHVPKDEDIDANYSKVGSDEQIVKGGRTKEPLSNDELLAQTVSFLIAGYDNITTVLGLAAYEIAMHEEIQSKLIDDVDQALQNNQGKLTYEAIQQMKYMDNVISETLRMYPLAFRLERMSVQDYVLGDTGITIPKGMIIAASVYAIHHDPEYYPQPEKFDPDRFLPEERMKRSAYAYIPFGGGPRNCVAMRFALLQMKVCLARVLSRFRFSIDPKMKVPLEFETMAFLVQPKPILLQLHVRNDIPQDLL